MSWPDPIQAATVGRYEQEGDEYAELEWRLRRAEEAEGSEDPTRALRLLEEALARLTALRDRLRAETAGAS